MVLTPQNPVRGEQVDIRLLSRTLNLRGVTIRWLVNGQQVESGVGVTSISLTPEATRQFEISAIIGSENDDLEFSKTFTPSEIDMIWEALDSYTPPLFEGKALFSGDGTVRVTANPFIYRPDGTQYSPSNLVYDWEYNGLVYGDRSGFGRSSFEINAGSGRSQVTVEISSRSGQILAKESITFYAQQSNLAIYQFLPLQGVLFNSAVSNEFIMESPEVNFVAYPLYVDISSVNDRNVTYNWRINNLPADGDGNQITFVNANDTEGRADISLEVSTEPRFWGPLDKSFTLEF